MKKRDYSKAEILAILKEETVSMTPADIETLVKIFNYLTFAELKRVGQAIRKIESGGTY